MQVNVVPFNPRQGQVVCHQHSARCDQCSKVAVVQSREKRTAARWGRGEIVRGDHCSLLNNFSKAMFEKGKLFVMQLSGLVVPVVATDLSSYAAIEEIDDASLEDSCCCCCSDERKLLFWDDIRRAENMRKSPRTKKTPLPEKQSQKKRSVKKENKKENKNKVLEMARRDCR